MIDLRRRARLLEEPRDDVGLRLILGPQHLDRELAAELGIACVIDDAEAAGPQAFAELVRRVSGETPEDLDIETEDAYGIAARVELPVETKQALLEQRAESERMRVLGNALRALVAAVARSGEIAERAKMNGKVIVG